jgi:hypothetical protein
MDKVNLAWNLFTELRKELVESQKLRAQVIGFKITFVSAAIGLIGTNIDKIPNILLVIPAFAAIFFDFLINSYSFSIKRIGFYFWKNIEPLLKNACELPKEFFLWEEFLKSLKTDQNLSLMGHLGITLLAIAAAVIVLFLPFRLILSSVLLVTLAVLLGLDIWAFRLPKRFHGDTLEERKRINKRKAKKITRN